jgi:hypothetical protein
MANRHRGEIEAEIGGVRRRLVLTLGALAELEDAFGADDLVALTERFGAGLWRELRHRAERQGVAADARVAQRLERRNRRGHCSRACGRSENPDCRYL